MIKQAIHHSAVGIINLGISQSDASVTPLNQWESTYTPAGAIPVGIKHTLSELTDTLCHWHAGSDAFLGSAILAAEWENYDAWYRCAFKSFNYQDFTQHLLHFEGLATRVDVWLNDQLLFSSHNMFLQHVADISHVLKTDNCLVIRAQALAPLLNERKPRPKWRTTFTAHKNQAWFRTSLLGRIPTWSPPPPIIGPWLPVTLVQKKSISVESSNISSEVVGDSGIVTICVDLRSLVGKKINGVNLKVGDRTQALIINSAQKNADLSIYEGQLVLENIEHWWPHTHGTPRLYPVALDVLLEDESVEIIFASIGFRACIWQNLTAALNDTQQFNADFGLLINDQKIFCRGACWTPLNTAEGLANEAQLRAQLLMLCAAGINMLRISGTFVYESDCFYKLCDEIGILVWQDFMFARLAYPFDDLDFRTQALLEAQQILYRLRSRPSIVILCGNTEVEQQTAMLGLPFDEKTHAFFRETLAQLCHEMAPHLAYWPSSPAGGELPFKITQGVSHYFGVGGYQRGIEDAQLNSPQFASECLAFSNIPENKGLTPFLPEHAGFPTHPDYKAGVPRDVSVGWDFADITDHYIERLFQLDTRSLRYQDPARYYTLAKVACGEVMAKVMGLWRRQSSPCNGALIWFLRDLSKGAGWGIIDSDGSAKAVYFYLKRAWAPLALWFVDEGLNGLSLHLGYERCDPLTLELEILRYCASGQIMANVRVPVQLAPRSESQWNIEALLGGFFDVTYSYKFGPRDYTLIHAKLWTATPDGHALLTEAFYYPISLGITIFQEPNLSACATALNSTSYQLKITTQYFARAIAINAYPYIASDNYFDLAPNSERTVTLSLPSLPVSQDIKTLRGFVSVLNGDKTTHIHMSVSN